jgi:hypothetical protein
MTDRLSSISMYCNPQILKFYKILLLSTTTRKVLTNTKDKTFGPGQVFMKTGKLTKESGKNIQTMTTRSKENPEKETYTFFWLTYYRQSAVEMEKF